MKNIFYSILILFLASSCLEQGLDELPAFGEVEITQINFEYRYIDADNKAQFENVPVNVEFVGNTITATIASLPSPTLQGPFTVGERAKISLDNLVCYVDISTAANIKPLNGAPTLGIPGDFSQSRSYLITAADGKTTQEWVINVVKDVPDSNAYEGFYQESGTLVRIGNPADNLDAELFVQTIDENTLVAQAGKSVFNNPGITYFIQVNNDNSVTILSDPDAVVAIMPQAGVPSTYDPATKTFDLHYHYRNEDRLFDVKLVLK